MQQSNPVLVEVHRDPAVESIHRGAAVVVDHHGRVLRSWGDTDTPIYPRSAVKPLQALPLVATGAARALSVTDAELALACASHGGEPAHTEAVDAWLARLGFSSRDLECGSHAPSDRDTRQSLLRHGQAPSPLHNNCSGKHTGFLTVCRHLGLPARGYIGAGHPVQARVRDSLATMTGCRLDDASPGTDGCGIPVFRIPLRGLATGMAKLADPAALEPGMAEAARQVTRAMTEHPYLVAGRQRFCTRVMAALAPAVLVKTGAEGTYCAALLDRGLGVALKIDDGTTRAAQVAMGAILRQLGAIDEARHAELHALIEPPVNNVAGIQVGSIRPSSALSG